MEKDKPQILPSTKQEAFVDSSLYDTFDTSHFDNEDLSDYFLGGGTVDAWCDNCKKHSIFNINNQRNAGFDQEKRKLIIVQAIQILSECSRRGCSSKLLVTFYKEGNLVTKIGQFPSKAVLTFAELDESFKELPKDLRAELGKAVGLYAHGVGIGSFVYLRRIFEGLVEEAHKKAKKGTNWDEEKYYNAKMSKRIALLSKYLPSRLVKSANLYGILSKGLHELSEQECKDNFQLVKQAIQLILRQKLEDKEYDNIIKKLS